MSNAKSLKKTLCFEYSYKFSYLTQKPLRAADVANIIAAIKAAGTILRDVTGLVGVHFKWTGTPPLPELPEDSRLRFPATIPTVNGWMDIGGKVLKRDREFNFLRELIRLSGRNKMPFSYFSGVMPKFKRAFPSVVISFLDKNTNDQPLDPPHIRFNAEMGAAKPEDAAELFSDFILAGKWPVSFKADGGVPSLENLAGGFVEFSATDFELRFTWPGVSAERIVESLVQTFKQTKFELDLAKITLPMPDEARTSWQGLNSYFKGVNQACSAGQELTVKNIGWRLADYECFPAMEAIHKVLEPEEVIGTRLFEFELNKGDGGLLGLSHDSKGFYVVFGFNKEKSAVALQKMITSPLVRIKCQ